LIKEGQIGWPGALIWLVREPLSQAGASGDGRTNLPKRLLGATSYRRQFSLIVLALA